MSGAASDTNDVVETVHKCPGRGEIVTQCCGRTPFELPRTDRLTDIAALVTCRGKGYER